MNDIELDLSWVDELNDTINNYKDFYKETCTQASLYYLYVSNINELILIKNEKIELQDGVCKSETLLSKNKLPEFKISHIVKFNIDIEPREIVNGYFLKEKYNDTEYFTIYNRSQDIYFNETVCFLQKVNSIFVILKEQEKKLFSEIKKVNKKTKKVSFFITKKKSKTRKCS